MEEMVYSVPGMHCANCTGTVEGELSKVEGVASVTAELATKLVTVRGESLSDAALREAIDEAGYEVEP